MKFAMESIHLQQIKFFVTRVKSMQHTITHSKQDKSTEFYINLCKKNSHLQPKKAAIPTDHCWGYIGLRGFSMQYIP